MRQHLDITDVEAQTKIRAKYLRALENEDFGMLPGATFVKSFLRTYAEFLGLDPHLLVEEYRARHDPRDESELTPFARPPSGRQRRRPPRRPAWLPVAGAVLVILALLLVLGLTGGSSDEPSTSTTSTSAKKTATTKKETPRRKRTPRRPRTVKLRIVPAGPPHGCPCKGGGTPAGYEGKVAGAEAGEGGPLRLNLGRRGVRITVNGKRVRVPAGSDPIGFDFRPTRTRELPLGQRPCA